MADSKIRFIDEVEVKNKHIILRVDFNVAINVNNKVADDARIRQSMPTIEKLLKNGNRLIMISYLNRPKQRDPQHSLKIVTDKFQEYVPGFKVKLIDDFLTENPDTFKNQKQDEILFLENIRFYPEEKKGDLEFAKKIAALGDTYVNDAFGVCHRFEASIVGIPQILPSYGGLLLKKEIEMISKAIKNPKKPVVAIIGGAKISTKIEVIGKLTEIADYVIIGGGLANTFLCAHGYEIGKSYCEYDEVQAARKMLFLAAQKHTAIVLPEDAVLADARDSHKTEVAKIKDVPADKAIYDIGPETTAKYGNIIAKAKTIVWNGPVGYFENPSFKRGTDFIYYAITHNTEATSIVGGGDTLAAISKEEYLNKITHISTGGGAMLEFIEKGTLPGIEALKK